MPLVAFAALAVPQLGAAEIRDRAGIFTAEAIKKAETVLDRIERRTKIPVVIETIEAIPGLDRDASATEKRRAVEQLAEKRAREIGYEGVYLLISKNDRVFSRVLVKERFDSLLPLEKRHEVRDTLAREFKGGRFDEGLLKTTALLDSGARGGSGGQRAPASGSGDAGSQARRRTRSEIRSGHSLRDRPGNPRCVAASPSLGRGLRPGRRRVLLADGHGRNASAGNGAGPRLRTRTRIWRRIWSSPRRFLLGHARRTWRSSRWQLALRPVLGSPRWRRTQRCRGVSTRRISRTRGPRGRRLRRRK